MSASLTSPKEMRALLCSLDAVLNDIGSEEDREAALDLLSRTVQAIADESNQLSDAPATPTETYRVEFTWTRRGGVVVKAENINEAVAKAIRNVDPGWETVEATKIEESSTCPTTA